MIFGKDIKKMSKFFASMIFVLNLQSCVKPLPIGTCVEHDTAYLSEKIVGYKSDGNYSTVYWYDRTGFKGIVGKSTHEGLSKTWVNAHWNVRDCDQMRALYESK